MTSKDGWRLRCRDRKYDLFEERVVGCFPLDQKFRTVITRPGKMSRKYPGKAENCEPFANSRNSGSKMTRNGTSLREVLVNFGK